MPFRPRPAHLGAILAFLLLAGLVYRFGVDVLVLDQWSLVRDVEASYTGELALSDLLRPHNGHRIAFPRLILVGLARLTGWNARAEMGLTLLLAIGIYLIFARQGAALLRQHGVEPDWRLFTGIGIAVFSLNQWESWQWGIMMHVFLELLAVALGLMLLTRAPLRPAAFCGAVALGVVATLSQGSGLVYWGVGALVLAVRWQRAWWPSGRLGLWLLATAATGHLYLRGLVDNARPADSSGYVLAHPLEGLYFFFSFLGAPVVSFAGASHPPRDVGAGLAAGLLGVGLLIYLGFVLWRRWRVAPEHLLFFYALALHSAGAAVLTAIARTHRGLEVAFSSRYMTLSTPLWIGVLVLVLLVSALAMRQGVPPRRRLLLRAVPLLLMALMVASSLQGLPRFPSRQQTLEAARAALRRGGPETLLQRLHPNLEGFAYWGGVLRERQLSVFRPAVAKQPLPGLPIPLQHFGQELVLGANLPSFRAGKEVKVAVRVTNPTDEIWPARGEGLDAYAVRLSYHWLDATGRMVEFDGLRTGLPHDLGPGASTTLRAKIRAPARPGSYQLQLTMLQEGVRWFDGAGAAPLEARITVGE